MSPTTRANGRHATKLATPEPDARSRESTPDLEERESTRAAPEREHSVPDFPIQPFPAPEDEFSDDPDSSKPSPEPTSAPRDITRYAYPPEGREIRRTVQENGETVIEREPVSGYWLHDMRDSVQRERRELLDDLASLQGDMKDLLHKSTVMRMRLKKELRATDIAVTLLKEMVDPKKMKRVIRDAEEAIASGELPFHDDDSSDSESSSTNSCSDVEDEDKSEMDNAFIGQSHSSPSTRTSPGHSSSNKRQREDSCDSDEEREVERSVELPHTPSPRKKRRVEGKSSTGSSEDRYTSPDVSRRRETDSNDSLIASDIRAFPSGTSSLQRESSVVPPATQIAAPYTSVDALKSREWTGLSTVPEEEASETPDRALLATESSAAEETQIVLRGRARPLQRDFHRVYLDSMGRPQVVDMRDLDSGSSSPDRPAAQGRPNVRPLRRDFRRVYRNNTDGSLFVVNYDPRYY